MLPVVRVALPVLALIIRMNGSPFAPAVAAHLPVFRVGGEPAAVIRALTASLTLRPGTDALLRTIGGRDEIVVAVGALVVACFHLLLPIPLTVDPESLGTEAGNERRRLYRVSYRVIEFVSASWPMGREAGGGHI